MRRPTSPTWARRSSSRRRSRTPRRPSSRLVFEWSADGGTFTGTGPSVRWRAPTGVATPAQLKVTVKVTEPWTARPRACRRRSTVRVHDSIKEISDLSVQFLLDFSDQSNCARVRDSQLLHRVCRARRGTGRRHEQPAQLHDHQLHDRHADVRDGQLRRHLRVPEQEGCRRLRGDPGRMESDRQARRASARPPTGTDQTTTVYRDSRWWLCDSNFDGTTTRPFSTFIR